MTIGQKVQKELETSQYVGVGECRVQSSGWNLTAQASAFQLNQVQLGGQISMNLELATVSVGETGYTWSGHWK